MSEPTPPTPADFPSPERRTSDRRPCPRRPLIRLLARPNFECLRAGAVNVSAEGIGLVFDRRLEPGTVLAFLLQHSRPGMSRILSARVVHATPRPDGTWLIGCRLSGPLSDSELRSLQG
jgi:hypothetical protein